jgi:flagellar FliL protein
MPVEEEKKTEENEAAPSSGNKAIVKWAIVGVILLLFIGIEVGIAVFFVGKLKEPDVIDAQKQEEEKKAAEQLKAQTEMGATLAAPIDITVNINGEDGRYLKCGVQLEYDPSYIQLSTELEARKARIKDIILDILSSKAMSDLMTNDGKKAIREQIVMEVNGILPQEVGGKPLGKISRSYFDSFIIQ